MEVFATSIKEKYRERLINREKQWPPCHSDMLVRLELVEQKKEAGYSVSQRRGEGIKLTPLAYGDLFKGKKPVRKVLVEGDAGIGKTTLCTALSEDWARDKLFQQFQLLLLLPLRHKKVAKATSLPELLRLLHSSKKLCTVVADTLEENEGKNMLIIADGWDELDKSDRQDGSFLCDLVFGELLPFASVVITSRPFASAPLHRLPYIDRFVVVCGFNRDNIRDYIRSEFASDQTRASDLLEQFEDNPIIKSVCSIPLNCAIICHLWRTLKETLPTTLTELYTKVVLNIILRNLQKNNTLTNIKNLHRFEDLPEDLQQSWLLLCEFAFEAITKDQLVFSEQDLVQHFPRLHDFASDEKMLCFGLIQMAESILETGCGLSFHFLHLTFQEYLAALHLVQQPPHKVIGAFQSLQSTMVVRFFFGIYFHQPQNLIRMDCCTLFQCIQLSGSKLLCCHCAFEARNQLVNKEVIHQFFRSKDHIAFGYPRNAYDCAAVLHIITNLQGPTCLDISFSSCGFRECQIKTFADILASKDGKLQVSKLYLENNKLTDYSVRYFFHRAAGACQSLEVLDLGGNKIGAESIKSIATKSFASKLSRLDLSYNPIRESCLQLAQEPGSFSRLTYLNLAGSLTSDADLNGALLMKMMESLLSTCPCLYRLDLSRNNLSVPGGSALGKILSRHRMAMFVEKLWNVYLQETNLGDDGLSAFVDNLEDSCKFEYVNLMGNDIHSIGISGLADGVCSGKVIGIIYDLRLLLDNNPLGLEGTVAISRVLSSKYFHPDYVSLSSCQLTVSTGSGNPKSECHDDALGSVGLRLCQLPQNTSVTALVLNGNSFAGEAICILAGFMHLCPSLYTLESNSCEISSDDLGQLFGQLTELKGSCRMLSTWLLGDNKIDDRGVSSLLKHLTLLFPRLGNDRFSSGIYLRGNHISDSSEEMRELKKKMEERKVVSHRSKCSNYVTVLRSVRNKAMTILCYIITCCIASQSIVHGT